MSSTIVGTETGSAAGIAQIGIAQIGVVVVGIVLVGIVIFAWRALRRRAMTARMQELLRAEGGDARLPRRRRRAPLPIRDSADVRFSFVMRDVERQPGDWRSWFRLSLAYADAGDRRRARKAMRQAMRLFAEAKGRGPTAAGTSA